MTNLHLKLTLGLLTVAALVAPASAVPVSALYTDLPDCDNHGVVELNEEIGDSTVFPVDEGIFIGAMPTTQVFCVGDDGLPNDWEIRMVNTSPNRFTDLFFVADEGNTVGNRDGEIEDTVGAPGGKFHAFRIDNIGANQPLVAGDVNGDLIFDPGESWTFYVTNFGNPTFAPPVFVSPGGFAGSSTNPDSTASIIANLVSIPEPNTFLLAAVGLFAIGSRRSVKKS